MISTLSNQYDRFDRKPELKQLTGLGLDISVTDGARLQYKGFIECVIRIQEIDLLAPMLIVSSPEYKKSCPIIIGTNIIKVCRGYFQRLYQVDK